MIMKQSDISNAVSLLHDSTYTLVLCKEKEVRTSTERGIKPMMKFIADGIDLKGFSAADRVVGKAAAMLFIYAGITEVYAEVMSKAALKCLQDHGVKSSYTKLTDAIINRNNTGLCPMEQAVMDINSPETAYTVLKEALIKLST